MDEPKSSPVSRTEKFPPGFAPTINDQLHAALEYLFDRLNDDLFAPFAKDSGGNPAGRVPACILSIEHSSTRYRGFAAKAAWSDQHGQLLDQITIVLGQSRPICLQSVASTLAHEMCHAQQFAAGTMGKGNYHNADFRRRMRSIGLQTSANGEPGGRTIGTGMMHYVIEGGPFDVFIHELIGEGFGFPVDAVFHRGKRPGADPAGAKFIDKSKMKFFCPKCGQIARAKITARLKCGRANCANTPLIIDW